MEKDNEQPSITLQQQDNSFLQTYGWAKSRSDIVSLYYDHHIDERELTELYHLWKNTNVYIVMQERQCPIDRAPKSLLIKASRRGNDVYRYRIRTRFEPLTDKCHQYKGQPLIDTNARRTTSNCLFVTLTTNPAMYKHDIHGSWQTTPKLYNEFLTRLRQQYGHVSELRCFESFESGYPHVHIILIFKDTEFNVHRYRYKHGKRKGQLGYLVSDETRELFRQYWNGQNVNIEAVQSMGAVGYLLKYITKEQFTKSAGYTASMIWAHGLRSYAVSKDFNDNVDYVVTGENVRVHTDMHNSNKNQTGIMQDSYDESLFSYVGTVELTKNVELWRFVVDPPPNEQDELVENHNDYKRMLSEYYSWYGQLDHDQEAPSRPILGYNYHYPRFTMGEIYGADSNAS